MLAPDIPNSSGSLPDQPLIAIVGPTGVGKTALSLELAVRVTGEVVNGDSRQVYRGMDIGTAKPKPEELQRAAHRLIGIADPDEDFSLARYLGLARGAIADIHRRGKTPILVGGTGQYVWALLEGWQAPQAPPDPDLRARLQARAGAGEAGELFAELQKRDPEAARFIDKRNVRRVIRALEVIESTGMPFSAQRVKSPPPWATSILGLTMRRDALYARLDARVDQMLADGWVEEVRRLLDAGYAPDLPAFSSLGYREVAAYLEGKTTVKEAADRIKFATHRLARRQYTWFRLTDPRIRWIDLSDTSWTAAVEAAVDIVTTKV